MNKILPHPAGKFDGYVRKRYNKLAEQRKQTFGHIAEMRLHLLNSRNRTRSPSIQLANWWYDNVTIIIGQSRLKHRVNIALNSG